jgi:hypothetical protein
VSNVINPDTPLHVRVAALAAALKNTPEDVEIVADRLDELASVCEMLVGQRDALAQIMAGFLTEFGIVGRDVKMPVSKMIQAAIDNYTTIERTAALPFAMTKEAERVAKIANALNADLRLNDMQRQAALAAEALASLRALRVAAGLEQPAPNDNKPKSSLILPGKGQ